MVMDRPFHTDGNIFLNEAIARTLIQVVRANAVPLSNGLYIAGHVSTQDGSVAPSHVNGGAIVQLKHYPVNQVLFHEVPHAAHVHTAVGNIVYHVAVHVLILTQGGQSNCTRVIEPNVVDVISCNEYAIAALPYTRPAHVMYQAIGDLAVGEISGYNPVSSDGRDFKFLYRAISRMGDAYGSIQG